MNSQATDNANYRVISEELFSDKKSSRHEPMNLFKMQQRSQNPLSSKSRERSREKFSHLINPTQDPEFNHFLNNYQWNEPHQRESNMSVQASLPVFAKSNDNRSQSNTRAQSKGFEKPTFRPMLSKKSL